MTDPKHHLLDSTGFTSNYAEWTFDKSIRISVTELELNRCRDIEEAYAMVVTKFKQALQAYRQICDEATERAYRAKNFTRGG